MLVPVFSKAQVYQTGDLIFHKSKSSQADIISLASGRSPFTHVGILEVISQNNIIVWEANGPVAPHSLNAFINRGVGAQFAVYRMRGITAGQQQRVISEAKRYDKVSYDYMFARGNDLIYCSELVELAYKVIGSNPRADFFSYEKISDLKLPLSVAKEFAKRRKIEIYHPECNGRLGKPRLPQFESCWNAVYKSDLLTPDRITKDRRFQVIKPL